MYIRVYYILLCEIRVFKNIIYKIFIIIRNYFNYEKNAFVLV